jgi:beta-xylosidase
VKTAVKPVADEFVTAARTEAPTARAKRLPQPVIATNTPDPSILRYRKSYYLVNTSGGPKNVFSIRKSSDLVNWERIGPVFPRAPKWTAGTYWAPELHRAPGGKGFLCYYTATHAKTGMKSIGVARAATLEGPWRDLGKPLVHTRKGGGVIDPNFFTDRKGRSFLLYKNDGNAIGKKTHIWIQRLRRDGMTPRGQPKRILVNDRAWEGALIEAPEMKVRGKFYYLFYSANGYGSDKYAVGVARSRSPFGPFKKHKGPILSSSRKWKGPGHNSPLIRGPDGKQYIAYHAWKAGKILQEPGRLLLMDRVHWENGWPRINRGHPRPG